MLIHKGYPLLFICKGVAMNKQTILIVDDDKEIREGIRILLAGESYNIIEASNGVQALAQLSCAVDLVILDIMMPGMSGLCVCEEIRKTSSVPILFLTAKAQDSDKLIGLSAGGDDYLTKPFSFTELIARVKALLRRYYVYRGKSDDSSLSNDNILTVQDIKLSLVGNQVWIRDKELNLTDIEYRILRLLIQHPQRIFSAENIYESVWNEPYYSSDTIMVHIRKLRIKIEPDPQNPKYIKTVWGKGYRFEVNIHAS